MVSKPEIQPSIYHNEEQRDTLTALHEKHEVSAGHGMLGAAHVFSGNVLAPIHARSMFINCFPEDDSGKVTGQLLLPRPTEDHKDPLVCLSVPSSEVSEA